MSHGKLRAEKNCLNCGHIVEEHYCPHCGQENTENRQPFHYLFTHFFEDFTHYDGQFWKTIKYLLFYPGKLTKIYLSGKRQQYVPPVKLYIFISFVTFFIASFITINNHSDQKEVSIDSLQNEISEQKAIQDLFNNPNLSKEDSIDLREAMRLIPGDKQIQDSLNDDNSYLSENTASISKVKSLADYDSITTAKNSTLRKILRPFAKKYYELKENKTPVEEIVQSFVTVFMHTFPKALFFYLPVFAFILYIFHNKKKWWYYDHGVFTLHYFSFLLFVTAFFLILNLIEPSLIHYDWFKTLSTWIYGIGFIYVVLYFFIAHHRFYATKKRSSILLGMLIFFFNSIAFTFLLLILASISLLMIH